MLDARLVVVRVRISIRVRFIVVRIRFIMVRIMVGIRFIVVREWNIVVGIRIGVRIILRVMFIVVKFRVRVMLSVFKVRARARISLIVVRVRLWQSPENEWKSVNVLTTTERRTCAASRETRLWAQFMVRSMR